MTRRAPLLRRYRWWRAGGHHRLWAAKLRRQGFYPEVLTYLLGIHDYAKIILEMILIFPQAAHREVEYRQLARYLTSPTRRSS
jgi:hypothetical protein